MLIMYQTDVQSDLLREGRRVAYDWQKWIDENILQKGRMIMSITPIEYREVPTDANHGHHCDVEATYVVIHFMPEVRELAATRWNRAEPAR